jgi:hypothetical protein
LIIILPIFLSGLLLLFLLFPAFYFHKKHLRRRLLEKDSENTDLEKGGVISLPREHLGAEDPFADPVSASPTGLAVPNSSSPSPDSHLSEPAISKSQSSTFFHTKPASFLAAHHPSTQPSSLRWPDRSRVHTKVARELVRARNNSLSALPDNHTARAIFSSHTENAISERTTLGTYPLDLVTYQSTMSLAGRRPPVRDVMALSTPHMVSRDWLGASRARTKCVPERVRVRSDQRMNPIHRAQERRHPMRSDGNFSADFEARELRVEVGRLRRQVTRMNRLITECKGQSEAPPAYGSL